MIKDILDLVFSAGVVAVAIITWLSSRANNKINIESAAFRMLNDSKNNLDKALVGCQNIDKITQFIESYLTTLNYVCSLFNVNKKSGKRFRALYSLDIKSIFKNEIFMDIINNDSDDYIYLKKAHVDIIERER